MVCQKKKVRVRAPRKRSSGERTHVYLLSIGLSIVTARPNKKNAMHCGSLTRS